MHGKRTKIKLNPIFQVLRKMQDPEENNKIKLPPSKKRTVKCYYCKQIYIYQNLKPHILAQHGNVQIRVAGQRSLLDIFSATSSQNQNSSPHNSNKDVNIDKVMVSVEEDDIHYDNFSFDIHDSNPQNKNIDIEENKVNNKNEKL